VISCAKFSRARDKGNRKLLKEDGVADAARRVCLVDVKSLSKTLHGDSHEKSDVRNGERCREDVL